MIKAVLDTNILVSALLSPFGTPAKIFDHVLNGRVVMCYDSRIITEYHAVLYRAKFKLGQKAVEQVLDFIMQTGFSVVPTPLDIVFTDQSDKAFYEVAIHVDGHLITGNAKHFPQKIVIVAAAEFLSIIEG